MQIAHGEVDGDSGKAPLPVHVLHEEETPPELRREAIEGSELLPGQLVDLAGRHLEIDR